MTCLALKMKRQLLVLLVVDITAGAHPPTEEPLFQQASGSALFPENYNNLHKVTPTRRFRPVLPTPTGDFIPSSSSVMISPVNDRSVYYGNNNHVRLRRQLRDGGTAKSLQGNLAGMKLNYVNSDRISKPRKETHRIKTRSSNFDTVGRIGSDFVFPVKPTDFIPKLDMKNCSEELCVSNVSNYPYHHIESLLQNNTSRFGRYFTDDIVPIKTRFDSSTDEELTCDAEETILYPKVGKTAANEVLFIINTEDKYKQGIRVEKCRKTGESPCNPKLEVPTGYRTYCKQKYIYRKLLALQQSGEPVADNFKIPSCCSCFISKETK